MIFGLDVEPIFVSVFGTLVAAIVSRVVSARARLVVFFPGGQSFRISSSTDEPIDLQTFTVTVENAGRKPTKNVEVTLSRHLPIDQIAITPAINNRIEDRAGEMVIHIPVLGPREHAAIQFCSFQDGLPNVLNVRSDDGRAKEISVHLQRVFQKPFLWLIGISMFTGFAFLLWAFASITIYFVERAVS